ncbi:hypothetical protein ACNA6I_23140 (plasmid) [Rossellomorea sp. FS2]|uniref:hypothetical protein n=1 Tax=Rossellomorea sp. FS2 TaxID=3391447 RepID=UPI003A4E0337
MKKIINTSFIAFSLFISSSILSSGFEEKQTKKKEGVRTQFHFEIDPLAGEDHPEY